MKQVDKVQLRKDIDAMYDAMLRIVSEDDGTPEDAFYHMVHAIIEKSSEAIYRAFDSGYDIGFDHGARDALVNASQLLSSFADDFDTESQEKTCDCDDSCLTGECYGEDFK